MKLRGRTLRIVIICRLNELRNSTAVTWALYAMTQAPDVQTKLRDELLAVNSDTPSMDELMALPYLDAVVKETLRVHAPVPNTARIAMKDDVLPVEKPYMDRYGVVRNTIMFVARSHYQRMMLITTNRIAKGDQILIPILMMNRSEELWGPDAHDFKYVTNVLSSVAGEAVTGVP